MSELLKAFNKNKCQGSKKISCRKDDLFNATIIDDANPILNQFLVDPKNQNFNPKKLTSACYGDNPLLDSEICSALKVPRKIIPKTSSFKRRKSKRKPKRRSRKRRSVVSYNPAQYSSANPQAAMMAQMMGMGQSGLGPMGMTMPAMMNMGGYGGAFMGGMSTGSMQQCLGGMNQMSMMPMPIQQSFLDFSHKCLHSRLVDALE